MLLYTMQADKHTNDVRLSGKGLQSNYVVASAQCDVDHQEEQQDERLHGPGESRIQPGVQRIGECCGARHVYPSCELRIHQRYSDVCIDSNVNNGVDKDGQD